MKLVIKNTQLFTEVNLSNNVDVLIENGKISQIMRSENNAISDQELYVVDGANQILGPGLVDLHTHLREPGREDAETIETAMKAAIAGGYTAISAMANTNPVADNAAVVELVKTKAIQVGLCDVFPIGAVTKGLEGKELADIAGMVKSQASVKIFSDDGKCVSNARIMRRAMEYIDTFGGFISQHAQEPELTINSQMNESVLSHQLGLAGWPAVAEEAIIARDIALAKLLDVPIHFAHISTAGSVQLVAQGKANGVKVTAEVTPHHLYFSEQKCESYDPIYKVNPPLRSITDQAALLEGLLSGVIDCVATDHAPHPVESKEGEFAKAAFGMLGLQSALGAITTVLEKNHKIDWKKLFEIMSINPAKLAGYSQHGGEIDSGKPANLVLIRKQANDFSNSILKSKSMNNPFNGERFEYSIGATIFQGKLVYQDTGFNEGLGLTKL